MMIRKIYIYLQYGGLLEVLGYVILRIKKIFYFKSETVFYYLERNNFNLDEKESDITFLEINNPSELESIDFDRIKTLDYKKWLANGSQAIIGLYSNKPVSFTWTHFNSHNIQNLCKIELSNNKCWTGPAFVNKSFRGKGINTLQKQFQIKNAPQVIKYFLTSVNSKNIASIKSIEKAGFKKGAKIIKYYGVFTSGKTEIIYKNNCESIFNFSVLNNKTRIISGNNDKYW